MQCPYCSNHFTPTELDAQSEDFVFNIKDNRFDWKKLVITHTVCPNNECKNTILSVKVVGVISGSDGFLGSSSILFDGNIIPQGKIKKYPDYIPEQIREDHEEACKIADLSPKAAATLARRCLQGMISDFHKTKSDQLKKAIDELKDVIEPALWEAIDSVRQIGNIGAHMEKDINTIIEIDPDEAKKLIGLIELLFEEWYIRRHERQQKLDAIKGIAEEKKIQKVSKPSPPMVNGTSLLTP